MKNRKNYNKGLTQTVFANTVEPVINKKTWYAVISTNDKTFTPVYEHATNIIPEVRNWANEQARLLNGKLDFIKAFKN